VSAQGPHHHSAGFFGERVHMPPFVSDDADADAVRTEVLRIAFWLSLDRTLFVSSNSHSPRGAIFPSRSR
jgi:hypothetical protein